MQTKLTLRMERALIERAKRYARRRGTSVSQMVADYLQAVTSLHDRSERREDGQRDLLPITHRLASRPPAEPVDEDAYYRHLEQKHLGESGAASEQDPA